MEFANVAVHPTRQRVTMYVPLKGKWRGLSSLNRNHSSFAKKGLLKKLKKEKVRSKTLDQLIIDYHMEDFMWLHIDTEGYDFEVLKSISLDKYHPKVIHYEHVHLSSQDRKSCQYFLEGHGYKIAYVTKRDTVAIKETSW